MSDKNTDYQLRLIDKYLESIKVYWSALLTVNGLLLTFFSISALFKNEQSVILIYFLIACCTLSLWLLVWNFRTIKKNYHDLGTMNVDDMPDVPEDVRKTARNEEDMRRLIDEYTAKWRQQNKEKAAARQRHMILREKFTEGLLILETLLILLILITKHYSQSIA